MTLMVDRGRMTGEVKRPAPQMPSRLTADPVVLEELVESDWSLVEQMSKDSEVVRWVVHLE